VIEGNLLVVPVGDSFLYFEPWYLKSTTSNQSLPELKEGDPDRRHRHRLGRLSEQTLPTPQPAGRQQVATPSQPSAGPTTGPAVSPTVANLITQALQHYNAAQDALKQGDLATYAREMAQVGSLLQQIDAYKGSGFTEPSASPGPRASPVVLATAFPVASANQTGSSPQLAPGSGTPAPGRDPEELAEADQAAFATAPPLRPSSPPGRFRHPSEQEFAASPWTTTASAGCTSPTPSHRLGGRAGVGDVHPRPSYLPSTTCYRRADDHEAEPRHAQEPQAEAAARALPRGESELLYKRDHEQLLGPGRLRHHRSPEPAQAA